MARSDILPNEVAQAAQRPDIDHRRLRTVDVEYPHIRVLSGDAPMLRLEINLFSWERGDSEIEVSLPHGGELSELLEWALPEQRAVICGNLRVRIAEELAAVFEVLQEP